MEQTQIDALRAMIENPIIAEFLDALFHCDTVTVSLKGIGETSWSTQEIHMPLVAMHNAMPELLEAWEMVQSLRWAFDVCCECASNSDFLCPLKAECEGRLGRGEPTPCINVMDFSFEWLDAYRERGE